jgi:hypothetical protein
MTIVRKFIIPAILLAAMCASAAITPRIAVNCSSGVAPLAVFVDATGTAGLAAGDFVNALFTWNFDRDGIDPAGKFARTRGFVAAHVYETPGTYTITLNVVDRGGAAAAATAQVAVLPFSGTTYYVASGGSNAATGTSMSEPLAAPDYALLHKAAPNTRILVRRGDRFTVNAFTVSGDGPVIVGAYSDPGRPSDQAPVLFNNQDGWGFISFDDKTRDWRMMDIHVRGAGVNTSATPAQRGFSLMGAGILLLRIEVDSMARDAFAGGGLNNFIFNCSLHDFGGYGYWCSPINQGAFVGNVSRRQNGGEHLFRTQSGSKEFIAYNDLGEAVNVMSGIQIRGNSGQAYLLGNRVEKDCAFHPQNSTSEEHESYCVADGNTFINAGFGMAAKHIAIRNNRFFNGAVSLDNHPLVGMSDSVTIVGNSFYGRRINEMVSGSATATMIKNNVLYTATTDDWASGLSLGNAIGNYQIDNNLYFAPNKPGKGNLWFVVSGVELGRTAFGAWQAAGGDVHGNYANPLFLSTDSSSADFLRLGAGSPAIGAGATVGDEAPVFCDFDGNPRAAGQSTDMGARLFAPAAAAVSSHRVDGRSRRRSAPVGQGTASDRYYDLTGRAMPDAHLGAKSRTVALRIFKGKKKAPQSGAFAD